MKRQAIMSGIAAVAMILLAGCGAKNPEKEAADYQKKLQTAKQTVATYPAFATALNSEVAKAESAFKATDSITDPKEKAKAIRKAGNMLGGGLFAKIKSVQSKISDVKKKSIELTGKGNSFTDLAKSRSVGEQAKEITASAEATLQKGAETPEAAMGILKNTEAELDAVLKSLNDLIKQADAKNKPAGTTAGIPKAKPVPTAKPVAPGTVAKAKPVPQWGCQYCKRANKPEVVKCAGCGAAKPAPKK